MELYPETGYLRLLGLQHRGLEEHILKTSDIIPITKYDYYSAHMYMSKPHPCLDLEMIYADNNSKKMYVFDKEGTWFDQGVYHDKLNIDATFDEKKWYDSFNALKV
mgnify:CR=1 FL=1